MEITYYGANCIYIATKEMKMLVDPVSGEYGPNPKIKADVVLYTQVPKQEASAKAEFVVDSPGEYEVKGTNVDGIAARLHTEEDEEKSDSVVYVVSHNDVRVLVCGNIHTTMSDEQVERVDGIDVLIVPVGGKGLTLDKEAASDFVRRFDPSIVIPVHYDDGKTKYPVPQEGVEAFLQEVGATDAPKQDSLKVSSREISEETSFVVLNPQLSKK